jgi:hypothetical protein
MVPSAQLPANRLVLDSAPLMGAMKTMLAADKSGAEAATTGANAAGSMVSKLENLSAQSQAEGIKATHNAWLDQSKASLGMKTKDTPDARPFAMQVDVNAKGQLVLGKGGKLTDAERQFIEKVGEQPGNTAAENFEAGRAGLIDKITQNNKGALQESLALVAQHIEGSGAPALSGYAEQAAALAKPALPATSARVTADAVKGQLEELGAVSKFLESQGTKVVSRDEVPENLRGAYDLLAKKHDLWAREQVGWGKKIGADMVPSAQLPANRLVLDSAPLMGAMKTMLAADKSGATAAAVGGTPAEAAAAGATRAAANSATSAARASTRQASAQPRVWLPAKYGENFEGYVRRLASHANAPGNSGEIRGSFNGTSVTARAGDDADTVKAAFKKGWARVRGQYAAP